MFPTGRQLVVRRFQPGVSVEITVNKLIPTYSMENTSEKVYLDLLFAFASEIRMLLQIKKKHGV